MRITIWLCTWASAFLTRSPSAVLVPSLGTGRPDACGRPAWNETALAATCCWPSCAVHPVRLNWVLEVHVTKTRAKSECKAPLPPVPAVVTPWSACLGLDGWRGFCLGPHAADPAQRRRCWGHRPRSEMPRTHPERVCTCAHTCMRTCARSMSMCADTCGCMYRHVHAHVCMCLQCACVCTRAHVRYTSMCAHVCMYMSTRVHLSTSICLHACTRVVLAMHMCLHTCVHVHTCMCIMCVLHEQSMHI